MRLPPSTQHQACFTGRSEEQVEEFIADFVKPVLDANKDILGEGFEMKN